MAQKYDDAYDDFGINYDTAPEPAPEPAEYKAQGEFKPIDAMIYSFETNGLGDTNLAKAFDLQPTEPSAADYRKQYELAGNKSAEIKEPESVFTRIGGKLKTGLSDAYDKDPLKFLEAGLGGLAGLYKTKAARDAAAATANGRIDEINAKAAADKAAQDRYNASFGTTKRGPVANKPLTRMDGSAVWTPNGRLKG